MVCQSPAAVGELCSFLKPTCLPNARAVHTSEQSPWRGINLQCCLLHCLPHTLCCNWEHSPVPLLTLRIILCLSSPRGCCCASPHPQGDALLLLTPRMLLCLSSPPGCCSASPHPEDDALCLLSRACCSTGAFGPGSTIVLGEREFLSLTLMFWEDVCVLIFRGSLLEWQIRSDLDSGALQLLIGLGKVIQKSPRCPLIELQSDLSCLFPSKTFVHLFVLSISLLW